MEKLRQLRKRNLVLLALGCGIIAGLLLFISLRVIFAKSHHTHYHANFGLFIDGQRDKFDNFTFYEEVQSCSSDQANNPKTRVHMHNKEFDTIHVHDDAVTWGNFFENLGYTLGYKSVTTNNGTYEDGKDGKQLTFILNGQEIDSAFNRVIGNEDVLLISYGDPAQTKGQFDEISKSAAEHNHKPDPATCSTSGELTLKDRLKQAVSLTD